MFKAKGGLVIQPMGLLVQDILLTFPFQPLRYTHLDLMPNSMLPVQAIPMQLLLDKGTTIFELSVTTPISYWKILFTQVINL